MDLLTSDQVDADEFGEQQSANTNYALKNTTNALVATYEYDGINNPGCSIAIKLWGGQISMGLKLTINQPLGIGSKTIYYPVAVTT